MKFCVETSKDLEKYFRNTFVKFHGIRGVFSDGTECAPADELIHSVESVTPSFIKGKRYENGEIVPYQFMLYSEHDAPAPDIEFILPRKSYFNTNKGAMLLERIPARQYRRGVCMDNVHIQLLKDGAFHNQGVGLELLDKYVRKPAFTGFTGVDGPSYAVSRRIAVEKTKVYVDQTPIGTINYQNKRVNVIPLFIPELEQVLRDCGQHDWSVALPESPKIKGKKAEFLFEEEVE